MNIVPLAEVCEILIGRTPSRNEPRYWNGDLPWLSIADMNQGRSLRYTKERVTSVAQEECKLRVIEPGTVVMSFKLSIGKVGIAEIRMATNEAIASLRVKNHSQLDPAYLSRVLESMDHAGGANRAAMGNTLNKASLAAIKIPVPPLDEQRRIAAILDKADELRAKRREALAHLDTLTQSIFHSMFGDPVTNSQNLPRLPLPEVGHLYSGGTPSKASSENWAGDVPWFSPKDIKASFLADSIDHIAPAVTETTSLRLLPPKTVVFVVRGMILAHSFPVAMLLNWATINQDLKAVRPTRPMEPEFLLACLQAQHKHAVSLVETAAHGTKKLTADGLSKVYVFDLPIELQQNFTKRVAAFERLKETQRKHLTELDALFASLQHRAFKGEL